MEGCSGTPKEPVARISFAVLDFQSKDIFVLLFKEHKRIFTL